MQGQAQSACPSGLCSRWYTAFHNRPAVLLTYFMCWLSFVQNVKLKMQHGCLVQTLWGWSKALHRKHKIEWVWTYSPLVGAAGPVWPPGRPALPGSAEPLWGSGSPSAPGCGSVSLALPAPCTLHLAPPAVSPAERLYVQRLLLGLGGQQPQLCPAAPPPAAGWETGQNRPGSIHSASRFILNISRMKMVSFTVS